MVYQGDALSYIYETPDILRSILEKAEDIFRECRTLLSGKKISEIYLTGSGSSYNAAAAVSAFAKKLLGIRVIPVYPAALMEDVGILSKDALVLGISQQGTSMAVIHALDAARERGITALSVTGEYDTEITGHGDAVLYVECGYEDAGATTKGYTATVFTLMLFMLMLAESTGKTEKKDTGAYIQAAAGVIQNMENVLADSRPWCGRMARELKSSKDMVVISGESLRGSLLEGVLKFSETCRFPVRGYEAEEFMHGIYNSVTSQTDFLYLFPTNGHEVRRMLKLYEYYGKQGNRQFAIHMPGAAGDFSARSLSCRFLDDADFSVMEYMLPQQMLFVLASRARGIDLNIPRDPEFHKYMKSKIE